MLRYEVTVVECMRFMFCLMSASAVLCIFFSFVGFVRDAIGERMVEV